VLSLHIYNKIQVIGYHALKNISIGMGFRFSPELEEESVLSVLTVEVVLAVLPRRLIGEVGVVGHTKPVVMIGESRREFRCWILNRLELVGEGRTNALRAK